MTKYFSVEERSIQEISDQFGLTVEALTISGEARFRIFKGANNLFTGTGKAARKFLADYERKRTRWTPANSCANGVTR